MREILVQDLVLEIKPPPVLKLTKKSCVTQPQVQRIGDVMSYMKFTSALVAVALVAGAANGQVSIPTLRLELFGHIRTFFRPLFLPRANFSLGRTLIILFDSNVWRPPYFNTKTIVGIET